MGAHLNSVILVDGNNLGFSALHGAKTQLMAGSINTTGIYGFLRSLQVVRRDFAGQMFILWDGRSWRHDAALQSGFVYKAGREATPEQVAHRDLWKASRVALLPIVRSLGVAQIACGNLEADDLAARLRRVWGASKDVLLVSGDYDWLGLVDDRTQVYQHTKQRRIGLGNFKEMTGFDVPRQIVEQKAMVGDKSDSIPPAGGIGAKTAEEILLNFGSVRSFANAVLTEPEARAKVSKRALSLVDDLDKMGRFETNLKFIDLDHPDAPKSGKMTVIKGQFDLSAFENTCAQLAFFSLTRDLNKWVAPFRNA